jgi:hypothetical protein
MGIVLGVLIFLFFLCVGGAIFAATDGFGLIDPYDRGKIDVRRKRYTVQDTAWQQFWYDRGFSRQTHLNSDAVKQREADREKAKSDRVIARAKSKGWIDES